MGESTDVLAGSMQRGGQLQEGCERIAPAADRPGLGKRLERRARPREPAGPHELPVVHGGSGLPERLPGIRLEARRQRRRVHGGDLRA